MQMIECFFITRFIYLFNTWSVELFFWINILFEYHAVHKINIREMVEVSVQ